MKFLIKGKQDILGMAYSRSEIIDEALSRSRGIRDHILKCVIYSSYYKDYKHWTEDEISHWISYILNMKSKKGVKLKVKDYVNNLFSAFGDDLSDAKNEVNNFHKNYVEKHPDPYPDFDVTRSLYSAYYYAWNDLYKNLYRHLENHPKEVSKSDIVRLVHRSLDKYCEDNSWLK